MKIKTLVDVEDETGYTDLFIPEGTILDIIEDRKEYEIWFVNWDNQKVYIEYYEAQIID